MDKEKLFLVDAYAMIYRGFFAFIKNPRITSKGDDTSAIFGFINSLFDLIRKTRPKYLSVIFDLGKSFRHDDYANYKSNRSETPLPIKWGTPIIKDIVRNLGISIIEKEGYEADDIIGTLAKKAEKENFEVFIMSPDKDFCQLVSNNIFLYKPARLGNSIEILGEKEVIEKYGFENPKQMIDYLAMMGDSSDNIPGLPGVGEKNAIKFLKEYGSIENLLDNSQNIKGSLGKKIFQNKELGILSKKLATIDINSPVNFNKDELNLSPPNYEKIKEIFTDLEFKRSLDTVQSLFLNTNTKNKNGISLSIFDEEEIKNNTLTTINNIENTPHYYQLINTEFELNLLVKKLLEQKEVCFDTETTSLNFIDARLVGIAFSCSKNNGFYIPFTGEESSDMKKLELLLPFFENDKILKIGHNLKYDLHILKNYGVDVKAPFFDTMIAHHLINSDIRQNMDNLSKIYLNYLPIPIESLIGKKGISQKSMRDIEIEKQKEYAVEDADITFQLKEIFIEKLKENNLLNLFENIEMPLMEVLMDMEHEGVKIDENKIKDISKLLKHEIKILEEKIRSFSEQDFNLSSPKQLGEILFEKLKIVEKAKKTKTGQYMTSEDVLLDIKDKHPIIKNILEWRTLKKLENTYVDSLPNEINKLTKRIHTTFNQIGTITGRLSSNNPNLQNIPIRNKWGEKIREVFVKKNDNFILLSADYSQIELRVMAEMSKEENMIKAFQNNEDIHTDTASKVFGVPKNQVSKEQRNNSKTINFGIIYGVSAFGLSRQTSLSKKESQELIDNYNKSYPDLQIFITTLIKKAREKGFVETLMGRRRKITNILSNNVMEKKSAERNAINTPIQGTAADIIKIAMINIFKEIKNRNLKSKMILQVHDELLFDIDKNELAQMKSIIKEKMENAVKFSIPLVVDIGEGNNWLEAH